jgi:hypothetical protein
MFTGCGLLSGERKKAVSNPDGDQKAGMEDGVHCLECGATLPADATHCTECGNERLILPTRWTPPITKKSRLADLAAIGGEARVLVGLTLALFCALTMLGFAAARTGAELSGRTGSDVQIVMAGPQADSFASDVPQTPEVEVIGSPAEAVPENIDELRETARSAELEGSWFDAVDAWREVTAGPGAEIGDFLSLAQACERVDDIDCATTSLNRACVRFPEYPQGYLALGSLHERLGNLESARFQYEVGLEYCPGDPGLRSALRRVEQELGIEDEGVPESDLNDWADSGSGIPDEFEPLATNEVSDTGSDDSQPESTEPDSTGDESAPVTLIGADSGSEAEDEAEDRDGTQNAQTDSAGSEAEPLTDIVDFRVLATSEHVTIEIVTDEPVPFSTSTASDPPRLIVRIPDARIATGSNAASDVALNVPLVERVNLIESSTDNRIVVLVVYLGEDTRHSVASDARTVRVTVWRAPGTESG